jgi:hypothetical protein
VKSNGQGCLLADGHLSAAAEDQSIPGQEWQDEVEAIRELDLHHAAGTVDSIGGAATGS